MRNQEEIPRFSFWLTTLALFSVFFYLFGAVTVPFTASVVFAYVLHPLYKKMLRIFGNETFASFFITFCFVSIFTAFGVIFLPYLELELIKLIKIAPKCITQVVEVSSNIINTIFENWAVPDQANLKQVMINIGGEVTKKLLEFILNLFASGGFIATGAATLVIAPFAIFFLLRDYNKLTSAVQSWVPKSQLASFNEICRRIDEVLSGYLKGQLAVSLLMGSFYTVSLLALKLDAAGFMGCLSGILSFAPTIGAFIGLVIASFLGIVQFGADYQVAIIIVVYFLGQFVEANLLVPNLIGTKVGLHPLWVFFAIYAGVSLYGVIGVIIAVPIAAVVNVSVRFALENFQKSDAYLS
ncbi:MAG: AI-2E family transporter [Holosporales bacterium]|jgi:predicted PurR-regulated permease PerM|nr:AI-2E family transporter [Holosporales bacterium]